MKKTLIGAAFAALAVTPVLAQQPMQAAPMTQAQQQQVYGQAGPYAYQPGPYAYQPGPYAYQQGAFASAEVYADPTVVVGIDGRIIGQDPDPSIRSELQREVDLNSD